MTKKKVIDIPVAPITHEEYVAMLDTWEKLRPILHDLGVAVTTRETSQYGWFSYSSQYPDGYHDITPKGIIFYHIENYQYEEGSHAVQELIPLDAILNPKPYIETAEALKADIIQKQNQRQKDVELENYKRLKAKFEK